MTQIYYGPDELPLILVTGATGTVGSEVVTQLVEQGERVRVLTRDPRKASKFGSSIEVVEGDLEKPDTLTRLRRRRQSVCAVEFSRDRGRRGAMPTVRPRRRA
jgi:uncharacterized protein YbjT (DUF2867 family)